MPERTFVYPTSHDPWTAVALARYDALLQSADLSAITRSRLEQLFAMNANVIIRTDARVALLTSVANAIEEHDDTELAVAEMGRRGVDVSMFANPYGSLDELLALERTLQSFGLVQCTALVEGIEQMSLSHTEGLSWDEALDEVHGRMMRRNA